LYAIGSKDVATITVGLLEVVLMSLYTDESSLIVVELREVAYRRGIGCREKETKALVHDTPLERKEDNTLYRITRYNA
jgi:hypothetical protein